MIQKILTLSFFAVFISLIAWLGPAYGEELVPLSMEIKYTNGDRIAPYQTTYVVYQDNDKTPFLEKTLETNPEILELPSNHRYKVEIYVNGMFSEIGYVQLNTSPENLNINIPLPGGLKFNVFFEDGETPMKDAVVIIKSDDGTQQRIGNTNENGETMRYWLQSTSIEENHYIVEVYFDEFMLTSVSNIKIHQGISQDQKVTVPIPSVVEELITFRLYDSDSRKILKSEGDFSVLLLDRNGLESISPMSGGRGEVYFSSLPSGIYSVSVLNDQVPDPLWAEKIIVISGNQNEFELFQQSPIKPTIEKDLQPVPEYVPETSEKNEPSSLPEPILYQKAEKNYQLTCNCVAFRLDGVQDYWLNSIQWEIVNLFSERNLPLTAGVIIGSFGHDTYLTEKIQKEIISETLEIANHGIDSKPFTIYDKEKQDSMLKESTSKIKEKLNFQTTIFIPPENRFNEDTIAVLEENGFTHLSASMFSDSGPFHLKDQKLFHFPAITSTGEYVPSQNRISGTSAEKTFSNVLEGIEEHGFAVVTIHPQEFSIFQGGEYKNELNHEQFQELESLVDKLENYGINIVHLGSINKDLSIRQLNTSYEESGVYEIPSWIKNNAGWWRDGYVDDNSFILSIQFLIKENILQIPPTTQGYGGSEIPSWVKENAGWWAEGKISDDDFIYGVDFLVKQGIIIINL